MGADQERSIHTVHLPDWGCEVTVAKMFDDRLYFPVRTLCTVLGIAHQPQIRRLQDHAVLSRLMRQLSLPTVRGDRNVWCIERRGIGFWLGGIQIASVRSEVRPRLLEFQEALVNAADRLLFGEVEGDLMGQRLLGIEGQLADIRRFARALEQRIGHLENLVLTPLDDDG